MSVCECQLQCQETVYWSYPIFPFGIVTSTFFPTTFLEIAVNVNVPLLARSQMAEFDSKRINSTQHVVKHKQPADLAGCSLSMKLLSSIINISVVQERITLLRRVFFFVDFFGMLSPWGCPFTVAAYHKCKLLVRICLFLLILCFYYLL